MQQIVFLLLLGSVAGFLSGMLGLGGAIVLIPGLTWLLGYTQQQAQGTTILMLVLPVGLLAAWHYVKAGQADIRAALVLASVFFVSSYFGARLALVIRPELLSKLFAGLLLVIALKCFSRKVNNTTNRTMKTEQFENPSLAHFSYAIVSGGEMVVVDPGRDPEPYLAAARQP